MRLNNKGQSLVMFVFVIPIVLLILVLVYDIGNAIYEKNRLSNTNYLAVSYALDNIDTIDENDVIRYILKDSDNLSNISVIIENDSIDIKLDKKIKGLFSKNFDFELTDVRSEYKGIIKNNEKNIERIK